MHVIGKRFCCAAGHKTNYFCMLNELSATDKWLHVKTIIYLLGILKFFERINFETQVTF